MPTGDSANSASNPNILSCETLCTKAECDDLARQIQELRQSIEDLKELINKIGLELYEHKTLPIPDAHDYQPRVAVDLNCTTNGNKLIMVFGISVDGVMDNDICDVSFFSDNFCTIEDCKRIEQKIDDHIFLPIPDAHDYQPSVSVNGSCYAYTVDNTFYHGFTIDISVDDSSGSYGCDFWDTTDMSCDLTPVLTICNEILVAITNVDNNITNITNIDVTNVEISNNSIDYITNNVITEINTNINSITNNMLTEFNTVNNNIEYNTMQITSIVENTTNNILTEFNTVNNNIEYNTMQIISIVENTTNNILTEITNIENNTNNILTEVNNSKNAIDETLKETNASIGTSTTTILTEIDKQTKINEDLKTITCVDGQTPPWTIQTTNITSVADGLKILNEQLIDLSKKSCESNDDCNAILINESNIYNTSGNIIVFYWQSEDKTKIKPPTTLREPIQELINPSNPEEIWNIYFDGIYQILGKQYAALWREGETGKNPLYKGQFKDKSEAQRFFASIRSLTQWQSREYNNPTYSSKDNEKTSIVNDGVKFILKKVCIKYKTPNSDKLEQVALYKPS